MTAFDPSRICIRPALASDKSLAAQLMYLSMHGLADHLFRHDERVVQTCMAELFERNAGRFGYELTRIAEQDDQPVGMLVSCAGSELNRLNIRSVPHFFAVMGLVDALAFIVRGVRLPGGIEAEPDEYYLSNIGVLPAAQGQGIGSQLLGHAENLARARSLFKCALLVGLGNTQAFCLYQRMGYRVVETVHDENESLAYHRMVKRLN